MARGRRAAVHRDAVLQLDNLPATQAGGASGPSRDVAELFRRHGRYWGTRGFRITGIIAWVAGAIAYEVVHNAVPALGGGAVPFVVSCVVYWAIATLIKPPRTGSGVPLAAARDLPAQSPRTSPAAIEEPS